MKTKEYRNPGSNPDHNLIPRPYQYTTYRPAKISNGFKYVFLNWYIHNGWPSSPFHNFQRKFKLRLQRMFFLRIFKKKFALL